jgi:hypothetical protein
VPARGAFERTPFAEKRPGDDAADAIRIRVPPRDTADFVEALERNDALVCGDLKDGIGRCVKDRFSCLDVFVAELVEDHSPALWVVPEKVNARFGFDGVNQFGRELRVSSERFLEDRPGDFPMASGGVLPRRFLPHATPPRQCAGCTRIENFSRHRLPEPERKQIGKRELRPGIENVAERVSSFIAVGGGVRCVAAAHAVED